MTKIRATIISDKYEKINIEELKKKLIKNLIIKLESQSRIKYITKMTGLSNKARHTAIIELN